MKNEKQESKILKKKPMNKQISKYVKFYNTHHQSCSDFTMNHKIKPNDNELKPEMISPLLNPNISLIEGSSFISNRQDGSFDSMDKMIITGVAELDNKEEDDPQDNNSSTPDIIDFTHLHEEYEEVIGKREMLESQIQEKSQTDKSYSEGNPSFQEDQLFDNIRNSKLNQSNEEQKKSINYQINRLQLKIQEFKPSRKSQDQSYNSIKFLTGNLSQIHEEWEHHHNNSRSSKHKENQDDQEKQLIDFVSKPDPLSNKNLEKNLDSFHRKNEDGEEDEIVTLLENELKEKKKKGNYQQILSDLDSKDHHECQNQTLSILMRREEWILHSKKSQSWKKREIKCLQKMRQILKNPYYDSVEEDTANL